jgi:hypothetical protein
MIIGSPTTKLSNPSIVITGNTYQGILTHANTGSDKTYTFPNASGTVALLTDIHAPVTLGTANGLSLSTQVLSLGLASSGVTGALSGTDWNTFNSKQAALVANTDYITPVYTQSKGLDLVVNGTGLLKSNYNFSSFTFDGTDAYYSTGCFSNSTYNTTVFSDELIPVDPNQVYKLSVMAKSNPHAVGSHAYIGVALYDADGLSIQAQHRMYQANTLTTLAADLVNGATTIQLTSAANWNNAAGSSTWLRGIIVWNYVNSLGYAFPALTYSRNVWLNIYADGGISGNTITLSAPWAGGTIPAGTQLSNSSAGGVYSYIAASNVDIPATWTNYSGYIGGVDLTGTNIYNSFAPGTAAIKLLFLLNRDVTGNTTKIANVSFKIRNVIADLNNAVSIGALSATSGSFTLPVVCHSMSTGANFTGNWSGANYWGIGPISAHGIRLGMVDSSNAFMTPPGDMSLQIDASVSMSAGTINGPVEIGTGADKTSINSGTIGFNRRTYDGAIYDNTGYAYQWNHTKSTTAASDYLALQVYNPSGTQITSTAIKVDGNGNTQLSGALSASNFSGSSSGTNTGDQTNISGTASNITAYTINQNLGIGNQVTFDSVITGNNGNGTNFRIGDDSWIGDINVANTFRVQGVQNAAAGYICFGNGDTTALGRTGTGALTYGGNTVIHSGNIGSQTVSISGYSSAVNYSPNRTDSTAYPILWGASGTYSGQTGTIAYSCAAVTINSSTGTILATNVGATSDERLKTNITPILNPIDKVKKLNGFYFNWNELAPSLDKTTTYVGVSAQHTLKAFPEAVVEGEEYLSVTYNSFIPLLIECVKEQQKEIEELKRLIHDFTK